MTRSRIADDFAEIGRRLRELRGEPAQQPVCRDHFVDPEIGRCWHCGSSAEPVASAGETPRK
jgi:hypothetical protein